MGCIGSLLSGVCPSISGASVRYVITADCNYRTLSTAELRDKFLIQDLCVPGAATLARTEAGAMRRS